MAAQITPLPTTVPSTADPANFDVRADATLGALPTFIAQTNALATEAESNAVTAQNAANIAVPASEVAVGAANYKGDYSAGTTYTQGQSVSYLGVQYVAKKSNTGITPVDGADWLAIPTLPQLVLLNSGVY